MKNTSFFPVLLFCFLLFLSASAVAQCTEAKDADMAKYKRLTETQDAQGCSQCAVLALYMCSARHSVAVEDKRVVSSLITQTKRNIIDMGQPYCCPELVDREPQWGIDAGANAASSGANSSAAVNIVDDKLIKTVENTTVILNSMQQSYYAAEKAAESKKNLSKLAQLEGDYETIDQLEREFRQNYDKISAEVSTLKDSRNQVLESTKNALLLTADAQTQAIGETVAVLGALWNEVRAHRDATRVQEELERRRNEELLKIEARRMALLTELRIKFINQFIDGGVPLSYHKLQSNKIYFFAYLINRNEINNSQVPVYISNVFEIQKFNDGFWPFKSSIINDLRKYSKNGSVVLSGYYSSQEIATDMRSAFIKLSGKCEFVLNHINYEHIVDSTPIDDVWGESNNPTPKDPYPNEESKHMYLTVIENYNDVEYTDKESFFTPQYKEKLLNTQRSSDLFLDKYSKNAGEDIVAEVYRINQEMKGRSNMLSSEAEKIFSNDWHVLERLNIAISTGATLPINKFEGFGPIWKTGRSLKEISIDLSKGEKKELIADLITHANLNSDYIQTAATGSAYIYYPNLLNTESGGMAYSLPTTKIFQHQFSDIERKDWSTDLVIKDGLFTEAYNPQLSIGKNANKGIFCVSLDNAYFITDEKVLFALRYNISSKEGLNIIEALDSQFGKHINNSYSDAYSKGYYQWSDGRYMITATLSGGNMYIADLMIEDLRVMNLAPAIFKSPKSLEALQIYNLDAYNNYNGGLSHNGVRMVKVDEVWYPQIKVLAGESVLEKAGLKPGDILFSINGISIHTYLTYIGIWSRKQGAKQNLVVKRDNQILNIEILEQS